jgi:LysM repeat protein
VADDWRRYVAPAAFLLAVTIAVILVRSALDGGGGGTATTSSVPAPPRKHVVTETTKRKPKPVARFWTVRAGDTFAVISAQTGVPVATLERLNPNVKSTSLFIGERIRIK